MKRRRIIRRLMWSMFIACFLLFYFSLPSDMFQRAFSTALYSADGDLLSARIAKDGQWRFPKSDSLPEKFKTCLLLFEDRHFYDHNGVYLPSVARAIYQNISQGEVVSGASTITMQVVRLGRDNPPRTMGEKVMEMVRAMRLEWSYSKDEILSLYAAHAPYGGNVVGLEAASWRYYGRSPHQLSWAESATLAVLPNAPSLIFPGKNQELLLEKRNRVLKMLMENGVFDGDTYALSLLEPLPQKPFPLPQDAPHLLTSLVKEHGEGQRYRTTIRHDLQNLVAERVRMAQPEREANLVFNAAVMVVEVRTGNVLAYVGNTYDPRYEHSNQVDIIRARRSTGSILKPFLYAAMLKDGLILPNTLLPDIPVQYDGFSPKNYSETFDGAVPASRALSRSLNVPSVIMLKDYGYQRFYHFLQKLPLSTLNQPADHYGLSLILGGAEGTLWDITHAYAGMSRTLQTYFDQNGTYLEDAYTRRHILYGETDDEKKTDFPLLDAGSIWCTYNALLEVNRPETELGWDAYSSATPIAWKTGTSFGNRDAWAIGTTPEYVVGVWVGNADGQGRPQLTGVNSAAPILFDVFDLLPQRSWFHPPYDDLQQVAVCHESGMRCGMYCNHSDTLRVPKGAMSSAPCTYHQRIFCEPTMQYRITMECAQGAALRPVNWFVLPPVQEYYYRNRHPEYVSLPPFAPGCGDASSPIGLIYPKSDSRIFVPRNLTGKYEKVVLEAAHRDPNATLYWHLDQVYLGETRTIHHMEIHPAAGKHTLTIVDVNGSILTKEIEVIER